MLAEAREAAAGDPDVFVPELRPDSHRVINALGPYFFGMACTSFDMPWKMNPR